MTHKLRNNVSVLEGSGGNIGVLTRPDGKVLVDAGIGVSRAQLTNALAALGSDPITHLINTHWHFDHADGNTWLHSVGAKIIAQNNTRKHLSGVQRVEDWDYNFLPLPVGALPSEVFAEEHQLKQWSVARPEILRPGAHRRRYLRYLRRDKCCSRR